MTGFNSKQQMAADKLQEDLINYGTAWSQDGKRIDPMSVCQEQPAQEPTGMLNIERLDKWLDASLKERKQREWVGLTEDERDHLTGLHLYAMKGQVEAWIGGVDDFAKAIEAKLKERNHGA